MRTYPPGTAIPLINHPTDQELAEVGLPSVDELSDRRFEQPTAFLPDGSTHTVDAGIVTHIIVDPLMRQGVGVAAGTRVTEVGTPAMGLPVGTPAPLPAS